MPGALAGVRVLDFTEYIAGPYGMQMLADMGADVIKVEPPIGDFMRLSNPIAHNESRSFISVNRGKRSIVIDLKTEAGRGVVHRAAAGADVVAVSYRAGVARRLGVDYETLAALNPRLIYAENTAFGLEGPYAHKPGYDLVAQAMTGIIAYESQETPDRPHSIITTAITDFASGAFLAYAVVAALYQRERTGLGQRVGSSLFAAGLAVQYRPLLSIEMLDAERRNRLLAGMEEARRLGLAVEEVRRSTGYRPPGQPSVATNPYYGIYRTRDSFMVIACLNNRLRRAAAAVLEVDDPRVQTNEWDTTRLTAEEDRSLAEQIRERFLARTSEQWCAAFEAAGVPCGPVRMGEELYQDPHVLAQGLVLDLDHAVFGTIKMPNLPVTMSAAETGSRRAPPALGQHTLEVLRELGYEEGAIARLIEEGAVRAWN